MSPSREVVLNLALLKPRVRVDCGAFCELWNRTPGVFP